jgi:hypothetical protein
MRTTTCSACGFFAEALTRYGVLEEILTDIHAYSRYEGMPVGQPKRKFRSSAVTDQLTRPQQISVAAPFLGRKQQISARIAFEWTTFVLDAGGIDNARRTAQAGLHARGQLPGLHTGMGPSRKANRATHVDRPADGTAP